MAQPACINPIALPRCSDGHVSATSTDPADQTAPRPKPTIERHSASIHTVCAVAMIPVKKEYIRIEYTSTRARPYLSEKYPPNAPPMAEVTRVTEANNPA